MTNLLSLLPQNDVRHVVCFCLDDLHLSLEQTRDVLYDACKVVGAIDLLLNARLTSTSDRWQHGLSNLVTEGRG